MSRRSGKKNLKWLDKTIWYNHLYIRYLQGQRFQASLNHWNGCFSTGTIYEIFWGINTHCILSSITIEEISYCISRQTPPGYINFIVFQEELMILSSISQNIENITAVTNDWILWNWKHGSMEISKLTLQKNNVKIHTNNSLMVTWLLEEIITVGCKLM